MRIAPPEAPVTGYMFGKGIYFADMVSKSANYCCTNRTNNTGRNFHYYCYIIRSILNEKNVIGGRFILLKYNFFVYLEKLYFLFFIVRLKIDIVLIIY